MAYWYTGSDFNQIPQSYLSKGRNQVIYNLGLNTIFVPILVSYFNLQWKIQKILAH